MFGSFIGSVTGGIPVDYLGRKNSIIIDAIIFIVGTLILVFSVNYWMLVLGRLIVGYGISLSVTSAVVYVSEISPAKNRGMLVGINQFGISLGVALAYIASNIFVGELCAFTIISITILLKTHKTIIFVYLQQRIDCIHNIV